MRHRILSTGLCMTALTVLVFVVYRVAAQSHAQDSATTGKFPRLLNSVRNIHKVGLTTFAEETVRRLLGRIIILPNMRAQSCR